jgi:tetratricopeptide (TPR) repeat protein
MGNYSEAASSFEDAKELAHQSNDTTAEAQSSLYLARSIELSKPKGTLSPAEYQRADAAYAEAARFGDNTQKAAALNGRALLMLGRGDSAGALQQLGAINLKEVDPAHRAAYRFNTGLAWEKGGQWKKAYDSYVAAIAEKPEYQSSTEAAFRLLHDGQPRIPEAVSFINTLLNNGQTVSAGKYAKQLLQEWAGQSYSQELLSALLRYYAIAPTTLADLRDKEWPYLNRVASGAPHLQRPIAEIQTAWFGTFEPIFQFQDAIHLFPDWAGPESRQTAMAGLLKKAAGLLRDEGKSEGALARYSAAWSISADAESALYAATILQDQRSLITNNKALFDHLLNGIINVKGHAYQKDDWPNILRLHVVLGTIFEQQKQWGSETELRSAIFQWQHAITAEKRIRETDPNYPPSPMLYMSLAKAYRAKGDVKALDFYLSAGEAFAKAENTKDARTALQAASTLKWAGADSPPAQERLHRLDAEIKGVEAR